MKSLAAITLFILFCVLAFANAYVFINSIKLSNQINVYEKEISVLHRENLILQNKIDDVNSLKYASSLAAELNFTKKAQPVYLDNLQYARN